MLFETSVENALIKDSQMTDGHSGYSLEQILTSGAIGGTIPVALAGVFKLIGRMIGTDFVQHKLLKRLPVEEGIEDRLAKSLGSDNRIKLVDDIPHEIQGKTQLDGGGLIKSVTPLRETLTIAQASVWHRQQVAKITEILNPAQSKENRAKMAWGCFIAGTLVHTDKGLVPIEQLKVGDKVLSQPEAKGEKAYRTVVKTLAFDDKEIRCIKYCTYENQREVHHIYATDNHPIWIEGEGWTAASLVEPGQHMELADGQRAVVLVNWVVNRTPNRGFGWVSAEAYRGGRSGHVVDFRSECNFWQSSIWPEQEGVPYFEDYDWPQLEIMEGADARIKLTVFNIEVESFHTYYVGELGAWVHNDHCAGIELLVTAHGKVLPAGTRRFLSEKELGNAIQDNDANGYIVPSLYRAQGLDELESRLTDQVSGDALYRMDIEPKSCGDDPEFQIKNVVAQPMCFVAGTLVHTDKGLVPIEQIKVGDMVLSKPDSGEGEQAYKPVVGTMRTEDQEVYFLSYLPKTEMDAAEREGRTWNTDEYAYLVVTESHPIFVVDDHHPSRDDESDYEPSWVSAGWLRGGHEIETVSGQNVIVLDSNIILKTANNDVGWEQGAFDSNEGRTIDFNGENIAATFGSGVKVPNVDVAWWEPGNNFKCAVYNLEVADYHTYYVGKHGLWVHNDCKGTMDAGIDLLTAGH